MNGVLALQGFASFHINLSDFIFPEFDHYEHREWFCHATLNEEPGPPGNLPFESDWNFFLNHEENYGVARTDGGGDYSTWVNWGRAHVSRPQRFLYEFIGNLMFREYHVLFEQLVVQLVILMIILKNLVMMLMNYIKKCLYLKK